MALESASYIAGLDVNNPLGSDPKSQGDDHIRMIKSVLKNTFPNLTGAVTLNQNELNGAGNPFPIQAGQGGKVLKTDGSNVHWESETQELPSQLGQAGKALVTDGSNAYWLALIPVQAGNTGKVLKTNGSTTYWADNPTANSLLPSQTGNTGKMLRTDGTNPFWDDDKTATEILPVQAGQSGKVLKTDGTTASWQTVYDTATQDKIDGASWELQTWQLMTRVAGVTYTNTTGRPMMVVMHNGGGNFTATIDGISFGVWGYMVLSFIVPAGSTYKFSGVNTILELR